MFDHSIINFTFFILLTFFHPYSTEFLEEQELESFALTASQYLDSRSQKIISVPKDCSDRANIKIDFLFKEITTEGKINYYAVYNNYTYYVRSSGVTKDHLPIIEKNSQPVLINQRFRNKIQGKNHSDDYIFYGPVYLTKLPSGKYKLIGFNQVWLGCPQPLCLSGTLDAAIPYDDHKFSRRDNEIRDLLYVFRGNYYWSRDLKKTGNVMSTTQSQFIDEGWKHHSSDKADDNKAVSGYIDAATGLVDNCNYFFKDNEYLCYHYDWKVHQSLKIDQLWNVPISSIDAALRVNTSIYLFKADQIWAFHSNLTPVVNYPKLLTELHPKLPSNISASFYMAGKIYIIKDWQYFAIELQHFPDKITDDQMTARYVFYDLFGCDFQFYATLGFHSYDNFIRTFAERTYSDYNHNSPQNCVKRANRGTISMIILILIALVALIVVAWISIPKKTQLKVTRFFYSIRFRRF